MGIADFFGLQFFEFTFAVVLCLLPYIIVTSSVCLYVLAMAVMYTCLRVIRKQATMKIPVKGKGVLITGCDTGFGHDLARRLDDLGFTVFAGCLHADGEGAQKLKKNSSKRLHIVSMDVREDEAVAKAHDYVVQNLPPNGLWGIVNNAGLNVMGDVEWCTLNLYHKCMNVNFYGAVRTLRTFLHLVRKTKGRVVIVTSVKGLNPWPADSAYHVTKHALETLSDSLRMEMVKFDVKVSVVEPGSFALATSCQNEQVFKRYEEEIEEMWRSSTDEMKATYGRYYLDRLIIEQRESVHAKGLSAMSTKPVIDALEDALVSERPNTRYLVPGGSGLYDINWLVARVHGVLPTWLSDFYITKLTGCDKFPQKPDQKSN